MSKDHITAGSNLHWNTPEKILAPVREFFSGLDLDPCSNPHSTVNATHSFSLPTKNGLKEDWDVSGLLTTVFVNPPFGKAYLKNDLSEVLSAKEWTERNKDPNFDPTLYTKSSIKDWVKKGVEQREHFAVNSIFLIPAAVDTSTWQNHIFPFFNAVCFIKGRVKFMDQGTEGGPSPMATALAYIGNLPNNSKGFTDLELFGKVFSSIGKVILL